MKGTAASNAKSWTVRTDRDLRHGYTLLELMLALALVVVATALIGSLMSLYARSFSTRAEDVKRKQLAKSLLAMIADDIRAVVTPAPFDSAAFEQLFGLAEMDLDNLQMSLEEGDALGLGEGLNEEDDEAEPSTETGDSMSEDMSSSLGTSLPLGIYGNQAQLMIDVSRVPRMDEFLAMQMNAGQAQPGSLVDVPGDMKRVTYYVQAASPSGIQDTMRQVESGLDNNSSSTASSGLIRRQIDRVVTNFAEASGLASQLAASGDLVAPEVVSLEFSYFDGVQWVNLWDSSQMGFPWMVNITLAIQSASGEQTSGIPQGIQISSMPPEQKEQYGIEVYQLTVAIPGAQLIPKPTADVSENDTDSTQTGASTSTDSGGASL